jgi:hypothetical protein
LSHAVELFAIDVDEYHQTPHCQFPPFLNTLYAISSSGCCSAPQGREGAWGRLITCE